MPGWLKRAWVAALCGLLISVALSSPSFAYDYPYTDPYLATVLGAGPATRKVPPPPRVSVYRIRPHPERNVPPVFWHGNALRFGLAKQRDAAPLVFVLGGTGNTFQAASVQSLRDVFFEAGFHVLTLSSPTTPEFITAASGSSRPGIPAEDARDLHRVMRLAMEKIGISARFERCGLSA